MVVPQEEVQLLNPETVPLCSAAVQVKVVPVTVEFKTTLVADPLQMV
jgi:hypothetical protein